MPKKATAPGKKKKNLSLKSKLKKDLRQKIKDQKAKLRKLTRDYKSLK